MMPISRRHFLAAAASVAAAPRLPADTPGAVASADANAFTFDLYAKLADKPGNVFASPFSATAALAMTAAGAKGDTLAQMSKVLHLPDDPAKAATQLGGLLKAVNGDPAAKRAFELTTANAVFAQKGYPWREAYTQLLTTAYGVGVREADFKADPEKCRQTINAWAEKQTRDKIKDLIPAGVINGLTRMVLANAVYFKGTWADQFNKNATRDQPFTTAGGEKVPVPMMTRQGNYKLFESDALQALELPYKGNEVAMVVALPRKADGLVAVEKQMASGFDGWLKGATPGAVRVGLPRFKLETQYALNDHLKALGMTAAFDARKADFTGMTDGSTPEGQPLYITAVVHKAFVDVNEEGTEAAAATGVVVGVRSAPAKQPRTFVADRPFAFAIRHVPTGTVLFAGRVQNPKGGA